MIDWLLNLVPWWGYLIATAIIVGTVWRLLGWQGALVALAGLIAALGYGKGRGEALEQERARVRDRNIQSMKARKETDDEVDQMAPADLDTAYHRWLRDDDAG